MISHLKKFRSFARAESGVAAIEMAFIAPLMMLIFFGLADVTDAVSYNRRVTAVANSIGDLVTQNRTNVLKTDIEDYFIAANLIMKPASDSKVRVRVIAYRKKITTASNGVTTTSFDKLWKVESSKGVACTKEPSTTGFSDMMDAGNTNVTDLIVTQACMTYLPVITSFLGKNVLGKTELNLVQTVTLRPRSSLTLSCFLTAVGGTVCPVT